MEHRKRSVYNLLYSGISQIVTIAIGLLLPRLYITGYGSETNGLLNSVNQFLVYLGLFEAGVGGAALQALYKPVAEGDKAGINGILSATDRFYKRTGCLYLASLAVFSLLYPLLARSDLPWITVAGAVFLSGLGSVLLFFFQGKYKILLEVEGKGYISYNLLTVTNILTGLAKIVLVRMGADVLVILGAGFLLQLIQVIYIMTYIGKHYQWIDLKVPANETAISQKSSVLIHEISGMIFQNTDILLLTLFQDLKIVSVYSLYKLVFSQVENLLNVSVNSVSFSLGQTLNTDRDTYIKRIDRFESVYSALAGGAFAVVAALIIPFITLYTRGVTDIGYTDSITALLFVICALLTAARKPMLQTIGYAGHYQKTLSRTIAESAINLLVSIPGAIFFGIRGVLFGTAAALCYRTVDVLVYANKRILFRSPQRSFAVHGVTIVTFLILEAFFILVQPEIVSYARFALTGIVEGIVSLIVCFGAQCLFFADVRKMVSEEVGRIGAYFTFMKDRRRRSE